MSNPRHLFILLGFLAQGLTWESYWLMGGVTVLWALAVTRWKGRWPVTLTTEAIALVAGCVISFGLNRLQERSAHFFLGDGLVLLQLARLTRAQTGREKLTALIIAAFHFGVVCTLAPNVRFVVLFTGALFVLPGALKETFVESTLQTVSPPEFTYRLVPSARVAFWLLLGSGFVFIAAPRFTGTRLHLRDGLTDQGSLLEAVLDPRRGGRENSQEVLMQIEGDEVGYMRCFGLDQFDGVKWRADNDYSLITYRPKGDADSFRRTSRYKHRKVHVKNSHYLGKVVPVDGTFVYMTQNFFDRPARSPLTGTVEPHRMWSTGNNIYEYYIDTQPEAERLTDDVRRRLLYCPPQSERLKGWLATITQNGTNAIQKAKLAEVHMRTKFHYEIGTPELNRLGSIDDFVFNRKEGHCERFAAAMAMFLRMQGVPSRVVIGYVPTTRNLFTGRLQVRFRDAHSWAEGYFPERGWVTFDATPGPPPSGTGSDLRDMLEALDFAWYSHVVNFNGLAQRELLRGSAQFWSKIPAGTQNVFIWGFAGLFAGSVAILVMRKNNVPFKMPRLVRKRKESRTRHTYDRMLHLLEKQGFTREDSATPLEFLGSVESGQPLVASHAKTITKNFCETYYGERELSEEEMRRTEEALDRLKRESQKMGEKTISV